MSRIKSLFSSTYKYARRAFFIVGGGVFAYNIFIASSLRSLGRVVCDGTILHWDFDKLHVSEKKEDPTDIMDLLSRVKGNHLSFLQLIEALHLATLDDRVKGLFNRSRYSRLILIDSFISGLIIDFGEGSTVKSQYGYAQLHELRQKIKQFKEYKIQKFGSDAITLIAKTDAFADQKQYYLATAFDSIQVGPLGSIPPLGLGIRSFFFKGTLEKLGIDLIASSRGQYKGALSTFTETKFPEAIKENLTKLMASLNTQIINDISSFRSNKLDSNAIKSLCKSNDTLQILEDISPLLPHEALSVGLIDKIQKTIDPFIESLVSLEKLINSNLTLKVLKEIDKVLKNKSVQVKEIEDYYSSIRSVIPKRLKSITPLVKSKKHELDIQSGTKLKHKLVIATIYLNSSMSRGTKTFGSTTLSNAILDAGRDSSVDAILIRLNSPGGDAISAEKIYQSIIHVKQKYNKPVIASFSDVCASGGYYIASACDMIIASPMTLTGSIGVASARPHILPKFMEYFGFNVDVISTSKGFENDSYFKTLEPEYKQRNETSIDHVYELFLDRVSKGRRIDMNVLRNHVAGGRVFSGKDAYDIGLIDQLGGFEDALRSVCKSMEIKSFSSRVVEIVEFPKKSTFWQQIDNLSGGTNVLKSIACFYDFVSRLNQGSGVKLESDIKSIE